jgi:hypothetical protein
MAANVQGDIGAQGVSRMHFVRQDATVPTITDCNAAAAAWKALWSSQGANMPTGITWVWQGQVTIIDIDSAELQSIVQMGVIPTQLAGASATAYPAGNGIRIDWLTATVHNRRFMRAANFLVPLCGNAYAAQGNISSTAQSAVLTACGTFLAAMNTAALSLVAYGRPAAGQTTGGHVGVVTGYRVPTAPASLRSRRS